MSSELHDKIAGGLADRGLLVHAGFVALMRTPLLEGKTPQQLEEFKVAYFAGAQHLWASMMAIFDSGHEPTPRDLRRMAAINVELEAWTKRLAATLIETKGTA